MPTTAAPATSVASSVAPTATTALGYEVFFRRDLDDAVICVDALALGHMLQATEDALGAALQALPLQAFFAPSEPTLYVLTPHDNFELRGLPLQAWACAKSPRGACLVAFHPERGPLAAWEVHA